MNLTDLLIRHEGFRGGPYKDTAGVWTIGIGRNLEDKGFTVEEIVELFQLQPMTEAQASYLLGKDIAETRAEVVDQLPVETWDALNEVRQAVVINMAFNLGVAGLFRFRKMVTALEEFDFETAGREMLDSVWARQVGNRAVELSEMMKEGEWI